MRRAKAILTFWPMWAFMLVMEAWLVSFALYGRHRPQWVGWLAVAVWPVALFVVCYVGTDDDAGPDA